METSLHLKLLRRYGMLIILTIIVLAMSVLTDRFLTASNLFIVARQVTINGVIAAGMTVVILSGGIDLSVGSVLALCGAVSAGVLLATSNVVLAIGAALVLGTVFGAVNGVLVAYPKLPPFIVTLANMALARGLTLMYTGGRPILINDSVYEFMGGGYIGMVPFPVLLMLAIYLILHIILTKHSFGRTVYAIGGNEVACRLSGIVVEKIKVQTYMISGLLCGVAAVILTSRLLSAQPTAGVGYELDAIAAVILGGTSLTGGKGRISGTIVGALIIGVLGNGLNLLNVSPFFQEVAKGIVILAAVLLDRVLYATGGTKHRQSERGEAAS